MWILVYLVHISIPALILLLFTGPYATAIWRGGVRLGSKSLVNSCFNHLTVRQSLHHGAVRNISDITLKQMSSNFRMYISSNMAAWILSFITEILSLQEPLINYFLCKLPQAWIWRKKFTSQDLMRVIWLQNI